MLLLAGTCIVEEAVLTGESTPQWKMPVGAGSGDSSLPAEAAGDDAVAESSGVDMAARLSIKRDKALVLFGGTKILQHTPDKSARLRTPDGGCLAVVLRTGFETAQGGSLCPLHSVPRHHACATSLMHACMLVMHGCLPCCMTLFVWACMLCMCLLLSNSVAMLVQAWICQLSCHPNVMSRYRISGCRNGTDALQHEYLSHALHGLTEATVENVVLLTVAAI